METSESIQSVSRETCLGLPFVEERPISEDERVALQREAKQAVWQSYACGCSSPFVFFFLIIIGGSLFPNNDEVSLVRIAPGIIIMVFAFGLAAACLLLANEKYRFHKMTREDLCNGHIRYYRGVARETGFQKAHATFVLMRKIAGADISPSQSITLEIFSNSRRLWQVNGTTIKQRIYLPSSHIALQPIEAQIALRWIRPTDITNVDILNTSQNGRRELSVREKEEILQRARTAWRSWGAVEAIIFTAHSCAFVIYDRSMITSVPPVSVMCLMFFWFAATIWFDVNFITTVCKARRLAADARQGFVIITRLSDGIRKGKPSSNDKVIEWLPVSKSRWTINGEPAQWRLRG